MHLCLYLFIFVCTCVSLSVLVLSLSVLVLSLSVLVYLCLYLFIFVCICVYCLYYVSVFVLCLSFDTGLLDLDAGRLARSQNPEGPATGHLDTGFLGFPGS